MDNRLIEVSGKKYPIAPLTFTKQSVAILEKSAGGEVTAADIAEIIPAIYNVVTDCLIRAGNSAESAESILAEIPMDAKGIELLMSALMGDE